LYNKQANTHTMTTLEIKVGKLESGYKVWYALSPMQRYELIMVNFTPAERRGVNGLRKMVKYIIDNNITA
jgi:hypothetical protein